jgi:hypothetical protein
MIGLLGDAHRWVQAWRRKGHARLPGFKADDLRRRWDELAARAGRPPGATQEADPGAQPGGPASGPARGVPAFHCRLRCRVHQRHRRTLDRGCRRELLDRTLIWNQGAICRRSCRSCASTRLITIGWPHRSLDAAAAPVKWLPEPVDLEALPRVRRCRHVRRRSSASRKHGVPPGLAQAREPVGGDETARNADADNGHGRRTGRCPAAFTDLLPTGVGGGMRRRGW